jgi:hypothetical protein
VPRPAALVVACLLLAACGAPHGTATLDDEPDLAVVTRGAAAAGVRDVIAHELTRLRGACADIDAVVQHAAPGTQLQIDDVQCQWVAAGSQSPQVVVGIIDGGVYRFHETAKLLNDERTLPGIGDDALYDRHTRALFTVRANRLWYVQRIGETGPLEAAGTVIPIARALMHASATS